MEMEKRINSQEQEENVGLYCINRYSKYDGLSMKTAAESP